MHRYYLTTMASGGAGFISVGMLFSIIDPYH